MLLSPEEIYNEYRDMVQRYVYRLCRNQALSEEITQETFYQALKNWHRFQGNSSIGTYLCSIAKRLYYTSLRKKEPVESPLKEVSSASDFVDQLILSDRAMTAHHLLHALSEPYREVFTLRTFCDMDHAQIGELFGKSASWARVTYYRARMMLLEQMKEKENND